ncbi:MAG TPA: Ig-like domain-containing protein [Candidatus Woesebacteria bacterium]|nr:Ig-like domain-containing protein [Candidatus Woesebacteria bacterium]
MDKKILIFGILFIIIVAVYIVIAVFRIPIFTQAANDSRQADIGTSLIFAWPLELKADDTERSEITVFIRDNSGRGLSNKQVKLTSSLGKLQNAQATTDEQGKTVFSLTSNTIGVAQIEAFVDNRKLQKTISVKFE